MTSLARLAPGLVAAVAIAVVAHPLADAVGAVVPLSPVPIAVLLGLAVANTVGLPEVAGPGVRGATRLALQGGVVLIGLKLSLVDVVRVGLLGIPVIVALVALALGTARWLAVRLGVGPRLGSLVAASTAICGITAALAVAPALDADEREVAYAVANVTLLGLLGMLAYPYVAHALFADAPDAAGLFLGVAIHDTSQVMGAALTYAQAFGDARVLEVATVTKLTRNALLVAVVPLLAWLHRSEAGAARVRFPRFVLGFLALSGLRTVGDLGLAGGGLALGVLPAEAWSAGIDLLGGAVASLALATALAGVGLGTRVALLAGLGPRPFLVGLGASAVTTVAALALAATAGP